MSNSHTVLDLKRSTPASPLKTATVVMQPTSFQGFNNQNFHSKTSSAVSATSLASRGRSRSPPRVRVASAKLSESKDEDPRHEGNQKCINLPLQREGRLREQIMGVKQVLDQAIKPSKRSRSKRSTSAPKSHRIRTLQPPRPQTPSLAANTNLTLEVQTPKIAFMKTIREKPAPATKARRAPPPNDYQ